MLCPLSVVVLVCLITVEVSCNLLGQLGDNQVILNQQPQPAQLWEQTEYVSQPLDSIANSRRNFAVTNDSPLPLFSAGVSRETVEAPTPLPQSSSGGCSQDFLNFPGSPSMIFNPGAHVNFVIGVPEDYKMEISDAPDGWKIITIIAPEGSEGVTLGSSGGVPPTILGNISSFSAGVPNSQYPFMRPLPSGSQADFLPPDKRVLAKPGGSPNQPFGGSPGSLMPGGGEFDRTVEISRRNPDGQFPDHSEPLKPGYHSPGLGKPAMESYHRPIGPRESQPRGPNQFGIPGFSGAPVKGYEQPGSLIPGMNELFLPSRQPKMHLALDYPDDLNHLPGVQTPGGRLKIPLTQGPSEMYLKGAYPDDRHIPSRPLAGGWIPGPQGLDIEYQDSQHPDTVKISPGPHTPGVGTSRRGHLPSDELNIPTGQLIPGYSESDYQIPVTRRLPEQHQPSSRYPGEVQPDDISPSGSLLPGYSRPFSSTPRSDGLFRPRGPGYAHPDDQYLDTANLLGMRPQSYSPDVSSRQQVQPGIMYPDNLHTPSRPLSSNYNEPGSQSPGMERLFKPHQPGGQLPDDMSRDQPSGPQFHRSEFTESQMPLRTGRFPSPVGLPGTHPDGQVLENQRPVSLTPEMGRNQEPIDLSSPRLSRPGSQTPGLQSPHRPSGSYRIAVHPDDDTLHHLRPGSYEPGLTSTPGMETFPQPTGKHGRYPDTQQQENIISFPHHGPETRTPGIRTSPVHQYGQPEEQYPDHHKRPSGALEFINPASQKPGFRGPQPTQPKVPGSYGPAGPRFDESASPPSEIGRYSEPYGHYSSQSKFPDGNMLQLGGAIPRRPVPGSQTPRMGTNLTPTGSDRFPDGLYPGMEGHPRQSDIPSTHPIGESPEYTSDIPNYQIPGLDQPSRPSFITTGHFRDQNPYDTSSSLRFPMQGQHQPGQESPGFGELTERSGPSGKYPDRGSPHMSNRFQGSVPVSDIPFTEGSPYEIYPNVQYPDNADGVILPLGPGNKPRNFIPGTKEYLQPIGPSERYHESFTGPQASTLWRTESPLIIIGDSAKMFPDGQLPDGVGDIINSLAPGYKPMGMIPMSDFGKPSQPSNKYADGISPDNRGYTPLHQPSGLGAQPGPLIPGVERFHQPNQPYTEDQIRGRSDTLIVHGTKGRYLENVNVQPQYFPEGSHKSPQLLPQSAFHVVPGIGKSPMQVRVLKQGADVPLPDFMKSLLEPFLTQGKTMPRLSPVKAGRFPIPSVSDGYPHNQFTNGHNPKQMGPELIQLESRSLNRIISPTEPLDRFPTSQHNQDMIIPSSYNKPGYQTLPQGAHMPKPEETFVNTIEHQQLPQDQDSTVDDYGKSMHMNAPLTSIPDYNPSVLERSPTRRDYEPRSQYTVMNGPGGGDASRPSSDSSPPDGMANAKTPRQSPQTLEYSQNPNDGSPGRTVSTQQTHPFPGIAGGAQSPHFIGPGQDGPPGGKMNINSNPNPPSAIQVSEGGHYSPEKYNLPDGDSPAGALTRQISSLGGKTDTDRHPKSGANYETSQLHSNPQGLGTLTNLKRGSELGYDGSHSQSGPQGSQTRFVSLDSPEGYRIKKMTSTGQTTDEALNSGSFSHSNPSSWSVITQYTPNPSADGDLEGQSTGSNGSVRMIPSKSTKTYVSSSPQSHLIQRTPHQATSAVNTVHYSNPVNQQTGQSSQSGDSRYQNPSMGSITYNSLPSTSIKKIHPGSVQSGAHMTYSTPSGQSIQYQQPRQTMVSRLQGSVSNSVPTFRQTYVPANALRSLDG